jgi:hypothetical protein
MDQKHLQKILKGFGNAQQEAINCIREDPYVIVMIVRVIYQVPSIAEMDRIHSVADTMCNEYFQRNDAKFNVYGLVASMWAVALLDIHRGEIESFRVELLHRMQNYVSSLPITVETYRQIPALTILRFVQNEFRTKYPEVCDE